MVNTPRVKLYQQSFLQYALCLALIAPGLHHFNCANTHTHTYTNAAVRPFGIPPLEFLLETPQEAAADWL